MTCTKCPLHLTARHVQIPGRGAKDPDIVFVGQAPGQDEDDLGRCFVGPAGQLLQQSIEEYDLKPAFLTNLVRCYPPDDRIPKRAEIDACKPYLVEELMKLHPKIIVLLGSVPLKALCGVDKITDYSGTVVREVNGVKIFALFHPSFILRYPRMLPKFEMHLRGLARLISGATDSTAHAGKFELVTAKKAWYEISDQKIVAFDFETTGKYKQFGGRIRCAGFSTPKGNYIVEARDPDFPHLMGTFLQSDCIKVAFNIVHELRWCIDEFNLCPQVEDPMLMQQLLDENVAHDLESVAAIHLNAERWDISNKMHENGWDYETTPLEVLYPYCALDAEYTKDLSIVMGKKLIDAGLWDTYRHLRNVAWLCARLESRGIMIDAAWAREHEKIFSLDCEMERRSMIKDHKLPEDFNPGSTVQLSEVLFKKLKIKVRKKTDGGKYSTAENVLSPLKHTVPFIKTYLEWKEKRTLINNFLHKFPKYQDAQGLIHPSINPARVVTGRLAMTEPPAQTFSRDPKIRGMVVSRWPKGAILSADYDALELRLLANEAEEPGMIRIFNEGGSPHDVKAAEMFGKNFTKDQRSIAKTINFGIAYGITEYNLAEQFGMTVQEALGHIIQYWKSSPKIYDWMRAQHAFVKEHGYIMSRFGRIRHLPEILERNLPDWQTERILRQAGNFPIQSAGADICNSAGLFVEDELMADKFQSILFHQVHDSLMIDMHPDDTWLEVQALNRTAMEKKVQAACPWMKVPLTVTQEVSYRWNNQDAKEAMNGRVGGSASR